MAKANEVPAETSTEEEPKVETPESKILAMASAVITGTVFNAEDVDSVIEFRTQFGKFLDGLKGVAKAFDEQLVNIRRANGEDAMKGVEYFRKPREDKKGTNSLLDNLKL